MKKALLITNEFPPQKGGVGNYLYNLAEYFPKDKLVILTEVNLEPINYQSHRIYYCTFRTKLPLLWPKWLPILLEAYKIIKKENIECILAGQVLPVGTVALFFHKVIKIPYYLFSYGLELTLHHHSSRKARLIKAIIVQAKKIFTSSAYTKNILLSLNAAEEKIVTVYPCAAIRGSNPSTIGGIEKNSVDNIKRHNKILLTVGRLVERKGHDMVIKSMPSILNKIPNTTYIIAGVGPRLEYLKRLSASLQLTSKVIFFEKNLSDNLIRYLFANCDVFLMPSRLTRHSDGSVADVEGFGIVFLEANLFNKPVIGGRTGGQPDAIIDGKSGLLVDPESTVEIADAAVKLLSNAAFANELATFGKARATHDFQWQIESKKITDLL